MIAEGNGKKRLPELLTSELTRLVGVLFFQRIAGLRG